MQLTFNLKLDFKANKKGENLLMIRCSCNEEKEVNEMVLNSKLTYINKYLKEVCKYAVLHMILF